VKAKSDDTPKEAEAVVAEAPAKAIDNNSDAPANDENNMTIVEQME